MLYNYIFAYKLISFKKLQNDVACDICKQIR